MKDENVECVTSGKLIEIATIICMIVWITDGIAIPQSQNRYESKPTSKSDYSAATKSPIERVNDPKSSSNSQFDNYGPFSFQDINQTDSKLIKNLIKKGQIPFGKDCGQQKIAPSSNDQTAVPNSWPWMVSLRLYRGNYIYSHFCSGVLIYDQYVLTSANCLITLNHNIESGFHLIVALGMHSISDLSNIYLASTYTYHSEYNNKMKLNDIGLIKLIKPVKESSKVAAICIPSSSDDVQDAYGESLTLIGWASMDGFRKKNNLATYLQQDVLKVANNETYCKKSSFLFESSKQYCASPDSQKTNYYIGDCGSPLMYFKNDAWYTYGIASYDLVGHTDKPNDQTLPSYYTQVAKYINWIGNAMANL